jgi:raffinose/stachyose/melibiose transport system substrate-binding protein
MITLAAAVLLLTAISRNALCGGKADSGGVVTVKWLASRPLGGEIDLTVREIAKMFEESEGGKWKLEVETTADRPSYLQKLKTLIAGHNMPDIIDIDADPYCQELVNAGMLVNVKNFLKAEGKYDNYHPIALRYQEFTDGSMYTLPLEYHVEMIWYNKDIFNRFKLSPPRTIDEWLEICKTLKNNGITPISVDGIDRWPVQRYLAMIPFRLTGNDYIIRLRDGKAAMSDEIGMRAARFLQDIGRYFNEGFGAVDYATAQSVFLSGKSAMYYIGDWEQSAMLEAYEKGTVDYFYLPMIPDAKTKANEFCVNSGIGMAFNIKTFDAKTKKFINYLIENYGRIYAGRMQMSPIKTELPKDVVFTSLYRRIQNDMDNVGSNFLKPWDTYLDADSNRVMQDNMLLLAAGDMSAEQFAAIVDTAIKSNTGK